MAMNKYMHPRNIYKSPPNFKQLALDFPEFRKFVHQDVTGKVSLDFQNVEALRALFYTLLKKDFDLDVVVPLNKLIPTVPLRLNYILWIEDLLEVAGRKNNIKGIDIGTGASCIYPLLAVKKNGWEMLATETDEDSLHFALNNVQRNHLENLIKVVQADDQTILMNAVKDNCFDFCMCNPPFFSSPQELKPESKARNPNRPRPKNSFCASTNEVVVKGGEVAFITKLIEESNVLKNKIKIYSTMVGHKRNLPQLKTLLRELNVTSFKETEFCQGNTTRWGLAWTFYEEFNIKKCPDPAKLITKQKPKGPLYYKIPLDDVDEFLFEKICNQLLKLFKELQMSVEEISRKISHRRYHVKAFANTWSNQRRKRRNGLKRHDDSTSSASAHESSLEETSNVQEIIQSTSKRSCEESLDGSLLKKLKIDENEASVFFDFKISIIYQECTIHLELECDTKFNREYLHQILQYIKNNLKD